MGIAFSSLWSRLFSQGELKILILGLDNAGKTTVMYKLTMGEVVSTAPTVGSNTEVFEYKNLKFSLWDLGGQTTLRSSWSQYHAGTAAVILVVDSTDRARLGLVREELNKLLEAEALKSSAFLVMANKQDVSNSLKASEISEQLSLTQLKDRQWQIVGTSALTGKGLEEGLDWLSNTLSKK